MAMSRNLHLRQNFMLNFKGSKTPNYKIIPRISIAMSRDYWNKCTYMLKKDEIEDRCGDLLGKFVSLVGIFPTGRPCILIQLLKY